MFVGIITALLSGILMSVQGVFNSGVTKQTSIWLAASFVQATALFICITAYFFSGKEKGFASILNVEPRYLLLGGVIGAFITYTVINSMKLLGPAQAVIFIVTMQLVSAYIIEVFGMFGVEKTGFDWKKGVGTAIIIAGIVLFKWEK